ncbi:gamma-aminobutyrate permease [Exiguobacterium sp. N4-1P]|uniref:amino acid permease n=1 Tax=Exiguobacterium sp. N4-1P TaxID=2051906 RepID=UPI000B58C0B8|nr:amino acid permease [Exiguobacterium sp. N4-1P]ASI34217.1 gamma-aminobutyrate permease [Exiguobacterium sp. N4-1P]
MNNLQQQQHPLDSTAEGLQRGLQARHMSMIAIGGAIGTGLFIASGASVAAAGPGGALLSYTIVGLMVYFLMTSLGEMAAYMPVAGSFSTYGTKFVDPSFGFALGWNYWYNWAVTIAVELVAAQIVMHYWFPNIPGVYFSALFLLLMIGLNYFSVKGFGEAEYWFAMIKVVTVIVFLGVGVAMIFGIFTSEPPAGFKNFGLGDAPFVGGIPAVIGIILVAGFSFQGTELVGIAAGESEDPEKNVPKAVKQVFWRILLFYVFAIFVIGMLIPYTSPSLVSNDITDVAVSPFTLVFEKAGLVFAAALMNAVILTSVLSAGNSGMYASTRMLYTLARQGDAPKLFAKVSKNGVPRNALLATGAIGALCFLTSMFGGQVYLWLLNASGMTGFIAWLGIAISHYRFRKGFVAQGHALRDLPYVAPAFPFGPLFAFGLCFLVIVGQNYAAFLADQIDWVGIAATYIGIPLFLVFWLGHKVKHRTSVVRYDEMEFPKHPKK